MNFLFKCCLFFSFSSVIGLYWFVVLWCVLITSSLSDMCLRIIFPRPWFTSFTLSVKLWIFMKSNWWVFYHKYFMLFFFFLINFCLPTVVQIFSYISSRAWLINWLGTQSTLNCFLVWWEKGVRFISPMWIKEDYEGFPLFINIFSYLNFKVGRYYFCNLNKMYF